MVETVEERCYYTHTESMTYLRRYIYESLDNPLVYSEGFNKPVHKIDLYFASRVQLRLNLVEHGLFQYAHIKISPGVTDDKSRLDSRFRRQEEPFI